MAWYYVKKQDCESLPSSQVPEGEFSGDCCTGGEQLPPLKSKTTHAAFYYNGKLTESYLTFLSGMTSEHLTENRGADSSTLSVVDSHVRTSAQPARVQESLVNAAGFGKKWRELSVKYDLNTHSWKTHRCLFQEDLQPCSVTLPKWGMMQNGVCWEDITAGYVRTVKESGYALLRPTASTIPHTMELKSLIRKNHADGNLHEQLARVHQKVNTPLCSEILMNWPEKWTDLKPLETGKFQLWLRSHGKL